MTAQPLRIDERNHVEKPLLDQLAGLGWEIVDLDHKQRPADSFRERFAEVVMLPVLREQIEVINPWLEEDQVEEAVRRLTVGFPGSGLLEKQPARLRFAAFEHQRQREPPDWREEPDRPFRGLRAIGEQPLHRRLQYKVHIPGTEHHIIRVHQLMRDLRCIGMTHVKQS